jgi:phosphatidylinositol kinase/protein kinase (PI-3  family)
VIAQALLVSQELIRVAILWHEMWHEGLEEASRLYFTEKNPDGMIAVLEPLHDLLEKVHSQCSVWSIAHLGAGTDHGTRDFVCSGLWQRLEGGA